MSDHAEKFAAFVVWANADDDPEASWTMARWQAKVFVAERDGLRARVEQLEAALREVDTELGTEGPVGITIGRINAIVTKALSGWGDAGGTH